MADKNTKTETKPKAPKAAKTEKEPTPAQPPAPDQAAQAPHDNGQEMQEVSAQAATYLETLADPVAARLYLVAREGERNQRHEERSATRLTTAHRTHEGVHVRVVENPDADMTARFAENAVAADRAVLEARLEAAEKRSKVLQADMEERLVTVNSSEEWIRRMVDAALGVSEDPADAEELQAIDQGVRDALLEHAKEVQELEAQAGELERELKEISKRLTKARQTPMLLLDKVYPTDAEVVLHIYQV